MVVMKRFSGMRKMIAAILLALVSGACPAGNNPDAVRQDKLLELISEYRGKSDFNVIQIGAFGSSAIKTLLHAAAALDSEDEDLQSAMNVIKGIRKIAIVDYRNCTDDVCSGFDKRLARLLDDCDMLLETKDNDDVMSMYGVVDENSEEVKDFVLYSPTERTLVCLFGTIDINAVAKLVAE